MDPVTALLWAAAAASGAIGWSGRFECLPVALGVLLCWRWSRSRAEALGVGLAYYGAASFGLVNGASRCSSGAPLVGRAQACWCGSA